MGTPESSVTMKTAWTLAEDSGGAAYFSQIDENSEFYGPSPPGTYAFETTIWDDQLRTTTDVRQRLVIPTPSGGCQLAMFKFFGILPTSPGTPDRAFAVGAIWGVSELVKPNPPEDFIEFVGDYLGEFNITLGTSRSTDSDIIPESDSRDGYFGRRCSVQVDRASFPGFRVAGHPTSVPSQAGPVLLVDGFGYSHMIVELRCIQPSYSLGDIALKAGFMYRFA